MGAHRRAAARAPSRLTPLARTDAHSAWFLALLVSLNVVDAFHLNVVWPMLPFLVSRDVGVKARDVGFYVGVCGAAAPLGAMCGAYAWGRVSDAHGRRPALIAGCVASTISVYAFGTATTTTRAALGRFLSGLANGNAAIVKTYVGEITTKVSAGRAFGGVGARVWVGERRRARGGGVFAAPRRALAARVRGDGVRDVSVFVTHGCGVDVDVCGRGVGMGVFARDGVVYVATTTGRETKTTRS